LVDGDTNGQTDVFVHDRLTGLTRRLSVAGDGSQGNSLSRTPALSADGGFVAFESSATNLVVADTNGLQDVFVNRLASTDLTVDKTSGAIFADPGGTIEYTIVVGNDGPSEVFGARVTDEPPARLGNVSWTCSAQGAAHCVDAAGTGPIDALVDLPVGDTATYTLATELLETDYEPVTNTATVDPPAGVAELDDSDNADSDTDAIGLFINGFESGEPD
jgi:uncharacterized repeat protein (TIGR01451 family)